MGERADMNEAIFAAGVALFAALLTQFLLRADSNRRSLRDRFFEAISQEQMISERMGYKARELITSGFPSSGDSDKKGQTSLESQLFSSVFEASKLTTISAEMESFGIHCQDYVRGTHRLRRCALEVCNRFASGNYCEDEAIEALKEQIILHAKIASDLINRVNRRFTFLGCFSNLHSGNKLR